MTDRPPDWVWVETLADLRPQMTRDTFDQIIAGSELISLGNGNYRILAQTEMAKDWQENRLKSTITRALGRVVGHPVGVYFGVIETNGAAAAPHPEPIEEPIPPTEPQPTDVPAQFRQEDLSPGQVAAQADYYKAFFEKGGAGYSMVAHHTTTYWPGLVGEALLLWKILDSHDTRPLRDIGPNYWSPPIADYTFANLAEKLNQEKSSYIIGEPKECWRSEERRTAGDPICDQADCCGGTNYKYLWFKPHPHTGELMCKHWFEGLLEILHKFYLVKVELSSPTGRKPKIQVWRMPPVITPKQFELFNPTLQQDYLRWLFDLRGNGSCYANLFGIKNRAQWEAITEPHLIPLMPGYPLFEVIDNFRQRQTYVKFMKSAVLNPNYLLSRGDNLWPELQLSPLQGR